MARVVVAYFLLLFLRSSCFDSVDAQSTKGKTSWDIITEMGTLSSAVEGLRAVVEGQAALLRDLASKGQMQASTLNNMEAKVDTQTALLANLNENVEMLETSLSDLKAESQLHKTLLNNIESTVSTQENLLKNLVDEVEWHEPVVGFKTNRTIVAIKGDDVDMWCVVRGTPLPETKWTRENGGLAPGRVVVENNGKVLRIKNVQLSDEGTYMCVAANGVGSSATQYVHLQVYDPAQQIHRIIESDRGNLAIKTSSAGGLWVIKLQNTTDFRLELDPLMTEPIVVIPEQSSFVSRAQSVQVSGLRNATHEFEGRSLAIVVPPGRERTTLSWAGLALDVSGVSSSTKYLNDSEGMLEWESTGDGAKKIFWTFNLGMRGELDWTLSTASTAGDQENPCGNISFSALQISPDGKIREIQKTCNDSSKGFFKSETSSQVLVLAQIKFIEAARSRLQVTWTHHDEPIEKNVDGIVAASEYTSSGAIVVPFNSTQTKAISSGQVFGVAFDWNSRKIYYVKHATGIVQSNLDGTESRTLLSDRSSTLYGVNVDPTTGNLYFGNWTSRSIRVCNNDANKCSTVSSSSDLSSSVFDLAVHQSKGYLFWSIYDQKVVRANMDGSNPTVLLESKVWGLDVDEYEDRLYWGSRDGIGSCDLNGQDIQMVPNLHSRITDVAIDGDRVYYTDHDKKSIHVISKSGANSRLVAQMGNPFYSISLFGTRVSNPPPNPCENSECTHLCVLVKRWSYRCLCPDNKQLNADGKTYQL